MILKRQAYFICLGSYIQFNFISWKGDVFYRKATFHYPIFSLKALFGIAIQKYLSEYLPFYQ